MPVIINDFEIVAEPPADNRGANAPVQQQELAQTALRPEDIERVIRHFIERRARIVAD